MGSRHQPMLSLSEDHAAIRLQCVGRMFFSRREIKRLRRDCEEEERWRQALQRRRARIERLERELRHVEELPASEIERYTFDARYGLNNKHASARTIQGAWRAGRRAKLRRQRMAEAREKAARRLQDYFRHLQNKRHHHPASASAVLRQKAPKSLASQRQDDVAPELPSMQRVRELQSQVTKHLDERRRDPTRGKLSDEQLKDLSQRAESAISTYKSQQTIARRDARERLELRDATASFFSALWACRSMADLLNDRQLEALSKNQGWAAVTGTGPLSAPVSTTLR